MVDMSLLYVVDEDDNVIGMADYQEVHQKGLRHRATHILIFEGTEMRQVLVTRRGKGQAAGGLLQMSAGGHVKYGQTYRATAEAETREELFSNATELPSGLVLVEFGFYKNDRQPNNLENVRSYYGIWNGDFSPCPREVEELFKMDRHEFYDDVLRRPDKYTVGTMNCLRAFKSYVGEPV